MVDARRTHDRLIFLLAILTLLRAPKRKKIKRAKQLVTLYHSFNIAKKSSKNKTVTKRSCKEISCDGLWSSQAQVSFALISA